MSVKRSRATYEAELQAQQSPFAYFGTPLPPLDPEVRDDGSYVPVWKQEARDERGRKRFHGAFTGGFSAGYFNTVGSKEGWTPSTFISSRSNRRKDDPKFGQQRPEDFMDEEDLADADESRKLQTTQAFSAFGSTADDASRSTGLAGLFRTEGDTMGTKLLKKMGWKDGQGIGPKILRAAHLGVGSSGAVGGDGKGRYLFAPENVAVIRFQRKTDQKGLGFTGEERLTPLRLGGGGGRHSRQSDDEDEDGDGILGPSKPLSLTMMKQKGKSPGGMGIGILNDTGSDDDDPYEVGPRISYNRVIGGERKAKKKKESSSATSANPLIKSKPIFISKKKNALAKVDLRLRKCHDGLLPLDGFVFGEQPDPLISETASTGKYPPPKVPAGWTSAKRPKEATTRGASTYVSPADAARASKLDPRSRAELLGEKQLPGKSVFDFLSASARERLVNATGNTNLPEAKGEIPAAYAMTADQKREELWRSIPTLDKETAAAAIARGVGGGGPYADNETKRSRFRAYLERQAGLNSDLPSKPPGMKDDDWLMEFHEFFNCARIFKPMSGFMASRFTTSTSTGTSAANGQGDGGSLITRPAAKPVDPAEEAAKVGMFGPLTRSSHDFYPTRLLCKRFNVKPPAHVQPERDHEPSGRPSKPSASISAAAYGYGSLPSRALQHFSSGPLSVGNSFGGNVASRGDDDGRGEAAVMNVESSEMGKSRRTVVDPTTNEALEGARAGEEVFRAVFGDSSDEE